MVGLKKSYRGVKTGSAMIVALAAMLLGAEAEAAHEFSRDAADDGAGRAAPPGADLDRDICARAGLSAEASRLL